MLGVAVPLGVPALVPLGVPLRVAVKLPVPVMLRVLAPLELCVAEPVAALLPLGDTLVDCDGDAVGLDVTAPEPVAVADRE